MICLSGLSTLPGIGGCPLHPRVASQPPTLHLLSLALCLVVMRGLRGAIKKKNYQTLDIVQTSADPPPTLGRYGRKKFGRSDLARTPPTTVVWTF